MPVSKYYGGRGKDVMKKMKKRYGKKKGKSIFYATAKKKDQEPKEKESSAVKISDVREAMSKTGGVRELTENEQAYVQGFAQKCAEAGLEKEAFLPLLMAAAAPMMAGGAYGGLRNLFRRGQRAGEAVTDLPFNAIKSLLSGPQRYGTPDINPGRIPYRKPEMYG